MPYFHWEEKGFPGRERTGDGVLVFGYGRGQLVGIASLYTPRPCAPVICHRLVSLYPRVSIPQIKGENSVVSHTTMSNRPGTCLLAYQALYNAWQESSLA
jgi:hypothetical protein